jgi:recombination protein RecR
MPHTSIESLERLKSEFQKMPGIGPRSAERLAFHVLRSTPEEARALSRAIDDVKSRIRYCSICYNLTEADPCEICRDPRRDTSIIVVVEHPGEVMLLEETGLIRGLYHVLLGHIAPLEGIDPGDLTIDALVKRVKSGGVKEVVLGTSPTVEGDGTALYIRSLIENEGVRVTRLARGIAVGSQLEYATRAMLEAAISGRTDM